MSDDGAKTSTRGATGAAGAPVPTAAAPAAAPEKTHVARELKHSSPLISCRFDPGGRFVFAGAQDSTVQRWELESGKSTPFAGHESWVRGMAFTPDARTLLTGGYDGRLVWWEAGAEKPAPVRSVDAHRGWVRAVAASADGAHVATCGNDGLVKVWSAATGELELVLAGHGCHVYNVAFHPSGQRLASADLKGIVKLWSLPGGKLDGQLDASALYKYDGGFHADIGGVRALSLSRDGRFLACAGITNVSNAFAGVGNPLVVVFDLEKPEKGFQHLTKEGLQGVAWGVVLHPQGFLAAALGGGAGGFLLFWRAGEQQESSKLKLPDSARDLDLHPDGLQLATAHFDGHLRLSRMAEPEKKAG